MHGSAAATTPPAVIMHGSVVAAVPGGAWRRPALGYSEYMQATQLLTGPR
jgi:hypothetical protein